MLSHCMSDGLTVTMLRIDGPSNDTRGLHHDQAQQKAAATPPALCPEGRPAPAWARGRRRVPPVCPAVLGSPVQRIASRPRPAHASLGTGMLALGGRSQRGRCGPGVTRGRLTRRRGPTVTWPGKVINGAGGKARGASSITLIPERWSGGKGCRCCKVTI